MYYPCEHRPPPCRRCEREEEREWLLIAIPYPTRDCQQGWTETNACVMRCSCPASPPCCPKPLYPPIRPRGW